MLPFSRLSRRRFGVGLLTTLALVLSQGVPLAGAQQPTSAFPVTLTDDSGVASTFAAPPKRVVSLSPGLTEITFALGAGDRLVAVDTFSDFPPEAKSVQPRLTTYPSPSAETK